MEATNQAAAFLQGKKILLIEDDTFLSDIISQKFAREKILLLHSADGDMGLKLVDKEKPDAIILDILLPGISGIEVLKRLKENKDTKDIPVFMFSNLGDKKNIEESMKLGAVSFYLKASLTLDELIVRIGKAMSQK